MEDLKIIGWTHFDSKYPTRKVNGEELNKIINLIQNEICDKGYIFSGEEHQNSYTGVPVFSDGTCFRASMRSWGIIMAQLFEGPNGEKFTYMDFYMSLGDDAVMPDYTDIDVEVAQVEEQSHGLINKYDRQIINEALSFGMPFMTTDKVLKKWYEKLKKEQE